MAKLSARGRTELLRMSKELPDSDNFEKNKRTYALMSDGTILSKDDARFKPDNLYPNGKPTTWGWKVFKKLKSPDIEKFRTHFAAHGYTEK